MPSDLLAAKRSRFPHPEPVAALRGGGLIG
jgi:hypothetical protein